MNKPIFKEDFKDIDDIKGSFNITDEDLAGVRIYFAWYGSGSYDGSAFVLFKKGGKLYEVNGGHCSCYGLEGQWEPEETTKAAIIARIKDGSLGKSSYYYGGDFGDELLAITKMIRM